MARNHHNGAKSSFVCIGFFTAVTISMEFDFGVIQHAKAVKMKPPIFNIRNCNKKVLQIENTSDKTATSEKTTKRKQNDAPNCQEIAHPKRKCSEKKCKKIAEAVVDISEDEEDGFIEIGDRSAPRKSLDPSKWKKNVKLQVKRLAYEKKSIDSVPLCKHKNGLYKCKEIRSNDVAFIRKIFAKHAKTLDENRYILSQVVVDGVKRHRPRNNSRSLKTVAPSFFLRLMSAKRIRVCKVAFGKVLGVGRGRLTKLIAHYNKYGEAKHEGRGGDHKLTKFGTKRDSVVNFIEKTQSERESLWTKQVTPFIFTTRVEIHKKPLSNV